MITSRVLDSFLLANLREAGCARLCFSVPIRFTGATIWRVKGDKRKVLIVLGVPQNISVCATKQMVLPSAHPSAESAGIGLNSAFSDPRKGAFAARDQHIRFPQVYHSIYNDVAAEACGCAILPIRSKVKGPAPPKRGLCALQLFVPSGGSNMQRRRGNKREVGVVIGKAWLFLAIHEKDRILDRLRKGDTRSFWNSTSRNDIPSAAHFLSSGVGFGTKCERWPSVGHQVPNGVRCSHTKAPVGHLDSGLPW